MTKNPQTAWTHKVRALVRRVEDAVLVILLSLMLVTAVAQILLRNFFSSGISWGDMFLRMSLLWVGLMGAMVATRDNAHINIAVLTGFLPRRVQAGASAVTELFAALVCGVLVLYGSRFVHMEWQDGVLAFAQVPVWACAAIIPVVFGVMALRYLSWSLVHAGEMLKTP